MKERLAFIKGRVSQKDMAVYYAWYNPRSSYLIDLDDAKEDLLWMIAEIERLRIENHDLRSPRYSELIENQLRQKITSMEGQKSPGKKGRRAKGRSGA